MDDYWHHTGAPHVSSAYSATQHEVRSYLCPVPYSSGPFRDFSEHFKAVGCSYFIKTRILSTIVPRVLQSFHSTVVTYWIRSL